MTKDRRASAPPALAKKFTKICIFRAHESTSRLLKKSLPIAAIVIP